MTARVDQERLWRSLMEIGKIGETPKGGCNRVAFTDLDRQGRDLFRTWAEEAGCSISVDGFGNMYARRSGANPDAPVVMAGSHLDTQVKGGKFDGILGVLAGLEAIRTMNDAGIETEAPIEVVNWTNEEGCIFRPMMGYEVWTGLLPLEEALTMNADGEDWNIGERLREMGYAGNGTMMTERNVACYLEAHIEQGPVLEDAGESVGVVDSTQGFAWYEITLTGREAHARPTPIPSRCDAFMGMSLIALEFDRIAREHAPGMGTVGKADIFPNSPNVIPGRVEFTADLRHPDANILDAMDEDFRAKAAEIAAKLKLEMKLEQTVMRPAVEFSKPLADRIEQAAIATGKPYRRMYTGAGHDACNIARFLPTAMIFVPCRDGISHNEAEWAEPEHCATAAQVLTDTLIAAANGEINLGAT
ncbi:MAG: Zn-dependent hydrolase [Hyphomicrobiales bacterium]